MLCVCPLTVDGCCHTGCIRFALSRVKLRASRMFGVAKEGIRCSFIKQQPVNTGFLNDIHWPVGFTTDLSKTAKTKARQCLCRCKETDRQIHVLLCFNIVNLEKGQFSFLQLSALANGNQPFC